MQMACRLGARYQVPQLRQLCVDSRLYNLIACSYWTVLFSTGTSTSYSDKQSALLNGRLAVYNYQVALRMLHTFVHCYGQHSRTLTLSMLITRAQAKYTCFFAQPA